MIGVFNSLLIIFESLTLTLVSIGTVVEAYGNPFVIIKLSHFELLLPTYLIDCMLLSFNLENMLFRTELLASTGIESSFDLHQIHLEASRLGLSGLCHILL